MQNKRGQFYLIAAIIIISIGAGFIAISNHVSSHQTQDIYYLRDEIRIESSKVIDYADYNRLSSAQLKGDLTNFAGQYINNSKGDNFYFIFGNAGAMTFMASQSFYANVSLDGTDKTSSIGTGKIYLEDFASGSNVTIGINGNDYIFKLNIGENFRFIVSNENGGQVYTATG